MQSTGLVDAIGVGQLLPAMRFEGGLGIGDHGGMSLGLEMVGRTVPGDSVRNVPNGTSRQTWVEKGYPFAGMIRIRFHGSGTAAPLSAVTSTAPRTTFSMDLDRVLARRKVIGTSVIAECLGSRPFGGFALGSPTDAPCR
jgi:hypothetical protein